MKPTRYLRAHFALAALACVLVLMPEMGMAQFNNGINYNGYQRPWGYGLGMSILRVLLIFGMGLLGFLLGWFLSPGAKVFRRVVIGLVTLIAGLIVIFSGGPIGWGIAWTMGYIAFFAGLGYWARGVASKLAETPSTFGSAQWADTDHLVANGVFDRKPDTTNIAIDESPPDQPPEGLIRKKSAETVEQFMPLPETQEGIRIGFAFDGEQDEPFFFRGDGHLLTVAPSRSGKGTSAIIPNLLCYSGSVLVIDPKGENALITSEARALMGQDVYILDPWGIALMAGQEPARFNPLDWLQLGDVDITENAMILADSLIKKGDHKESFWDEEGKALLQGIILYVATDPNEDGQRHLGRVRDLLLLDGEDLNKLFNAMLGSPHHVVASTGARCLQKDDKLLANVLATAQAQTHFLDSMRIRESLSSSDFDFADLKSGKITVYLVLPGDRMETFSRWLRLLVQQAITVNARNIAEKPDQPILFVLDEMASLGHMSVVEQAFGLMAGYGMQLWGIVQDLAQLKGIYGDRWQSFISNARAIQYFGSRDEFTAEYFSKLCGVTTVWNMQSAIATAFSSSSGTNGGSSSKSKTETDTRSATQRRLIFADELMRLPKDQQLVFMENMNPIQAARVPWFEDTTLKTHGVNLQRK